MHKDVLVDLRDLMEQATKERSHYYVHDTCARAVYEIMTLRMQVDGLRRALETAKDNSG